MQTRAIDRLNRRRTGARRDVMYGAIVTAALILFVGTGSSVVSDFIRTLRGTGESSELMASALLLNIALIIFGWRRYRELREEMGERIAAEDRATRLAVTDPLTGLNNRRAVAERTAEMFQGARNRGMDVLFLMLDLDDFKRINDLYGHDAGDAVLCEIAARMRSVAPAGALLARLGGDEFCCVLRFANDIPGAADRFADDLVAAVAQPFRHGTNELDITTSLGISRTDAADGSVGALMRRADIAMYAAKRMGKNRHAWFEQGMEEELRIRSDVELSMRRGIPAGEFLPYFEPQIDLATGTLIGFEMLARWDRDGLLVEPESFIPVAEETGLIETLSLSVMRQAFEEARYWPPSVSLSVNISPLQLRDPWLAQKILKLLTETGFPPSRLEVEITESSLFENLPLAQAIIASLKNQNIRVALDDFGTGYSSLAHLRALPFDRIKIDKSFVLSMNSNKDSMAIVTAIVGLGDSLGLPVTAEGIEEQAVADMLRAMGCHRAQGYHYCRPVDAVRARLYMAQRGLKLLSDAAVNIDAALPQDANRRSA